MEAKYYQKQYDFEESHWWYLGRRRIIERVLTRFAPKGNDKALEVGCGSGGSLQLLSRFARELVAVEMEPVAVEEARERGIGSVVQGKLGDALAVLETRYGLIAMFDVLEHIEDDGLALQQVHKLLQPGGRLVITVPAYQFLWSVHDKVAHHHRRYSRAGLLSLFRDNGYRIEYSSYFNTFLFPPAMLTLLASRFFKVNPDAAMRQPSGPVNGLLTKIFSFEAGLIPRLLLPFGLSIVLVAEAA